MRLACEIGERRSEESWHRPGGDHDHFRDLDELLAIPGACDLVVTTSNATAHLAGALGKRTWVLLPGDRPPFHYWSHRGDFRCAWYPSVELVTAPGLDDWPALAQYAAGKLSRLI